MPVAIEYGPLKGIQGIIAEYGEIQTVTFLDGMGRAWRDYQSFMGQCIEEVDQTMWNDDYDRIKRKVLRFPFY
jgi:hypothetical protein